MGMMEWISRFFLFCSGLCCLGLILWLLVGLLSEKKFWDWLLPNPKIDALQRKNDIEGLVKALSHSSDQVRQEAVQALTAVGQPAIPFVLNMLNQPKINYVAIKAGETVLIQIGETGPLLAILPDWDYRGRAHQSVIDVLAAIGDDTAVPFLIPLFKQPDVRVRQAVHKALAVLGSLALWQQLLYHEDARVRTIAARRFTEDHEFQEQQIVPMLLQVLNDEFAGVQVYALNALRRFDENEDARSAIVALLQKPALDEVVRETAVLALRQIFEVEIDFTPKYSFSDNRPQCAACRHRFPWTDAYWQNWTPGSRDSAGYEYFNRVFCPYCGLIVCDDGAVEWEWYGDNAWVNLRNELPPVMVYDVEWISDEDWPHYWARWPLKKKVPREDLVPFNEEILSSRVRQIHASFRE